MTQLSREKKRRDLLSLLERVSMVVQPEGEEREKRKGKKKEKEVLPRSQRFLSSHSSIWSPIISIDPALFHYSSKSSSLSFFSLLTNSNCSPYHSPTPEPLMQR